MLTVIFPLNWNGSTSLQIKYTGWVSRHVTENNRDETHEIHFDRDTSVTEHINHILLKIIFAILKVVFLTRMN